MNIFRKIDQAIEGLVAKADGGTEAFVGKIESLAVSAIRFITRADARARSAIDRAERRAKAAAVREEQTVLRFSRQSARTAWDIVAWPIRQAGRLSKTAGRGVVLLAREVGSVAGTAFRIPARSGRALESLLDYWLGGVGKEISRLGRFLASPVRNRVAKKAKAEALQAVTMTPDHKSHRELFILAGFLLLMAAGLFAYGDSIGISADIPGGGGRLIQAPGALWEVALKLSPMQLAISSAALALAAAGTVFWIRMLRDSYRREYPTAVQRTQWRLVTTVGFVPGAVLYFFRQYNRLTLRKFASRHVIAVMASGVAILVVISTYGTLWYFNQKAEAQVTDSGYQAPSVKLSPEDRRRILGRDRYGQPLKRSQLTRPDPFAPIPGDDDGSGSEPSPTPSPSSR